MRSQLYNTMLVLSLGLLSCGLGADLADENGTQWFPYLEWAFENPSWQGSAFDVKARATFVHQASGAEHTTEMFYLGETQWALRFAGSRLGVWTFTTSSPMPVCFVIAPRFAPQIVPGTMTPRSRCNLKSCTI